MVIEARTKRNMKCVGIITVVASVVLTGGLGARVAAAETVRADLRGVEEVPPISTQGTGQLRVVIGDDSLEFELSYSDLEGSVQQAHIHFGQPQVNGGIIVFLCSNLENTPAGARACPEAPATVTGVIGSRDVVGPVEQGIEPGAFQELVEAIEDGVTYVNVHTDVFPAGEIRAQLDHDVAARLLEELLEPEKGGRKSRF